MSTTNNHANTLGARSVTGICLAVCGALIIVWGTTVVPVSLTHPDFMSFVTAGLVFVAIGAYLVPSLPPLLQVAAVWLASAAVIGYMFVLPGAELMVQVIGCVPVLGLASWLTLRSLR